MATDLAWPLWMPVALQKGFSYEPESAVERMEVEAGPARVWPKVTQQPRIIPVEFAITWAEHALFDDWFHDHLRGGAVPFDINLPHGLANRWWTVYFLGMPETQFLNANHAHITAQLYTVGPSFATRSDDVSFTATMAGGLRIRADGTQATNFAADMAGGLSVAATGSFNVNAVFEADMSGGLLVAPVGTYTTGSTFNRITQDGDTRVTQADDTRVTE